MTWRRPALAAPAGARRARAGRPLCVALIVAAALVAAGCGQPGAGSPGPASDRAAPRGAAAAGQGGRAVQAEQPVYVAVGASESVGQGTDDPLSQAWPQVLFRTALPRETVFVNLGVPRSTVADALTQQAPDALRLEPALATVWLNVNDLLSGVTPAEYERRLGSLVRQLRRGGATKVLVANTPPLDRLPAYQACLRGGQGAGRCRLPNSGRLPDPARLSALVVAYNSAIARVVTREHATLVDLHAAGLAARAAGTEAALIGGDGFHPSTAGHQAIAAAFASALRDAGGI